MNIQKSPVVEVFVEVGEEVRICLYLFSFFLSFLSLPYIYCRIMFPFLLFPRLFFLFFCFFCGCLSVFVLVWLRFVFPSGFFFLFFYTPVSIGLSKPSLIYIYIRIHLCVLSVYSAGQIFPSFSFLHKFYCTNVQPKVNPCLRHQCDNTRFCSLHKLLSPRLNTYVGPIKARSRFTEKRTRQNNNLWLKRQGMMRSM